MLPMEFLHIDSPLLPPLPPPPVPPSLFLFSHPIHSLFENSSRCCTGRTHPAHVLAQPGTNPCQDTSSHCLRNILTPGVAHSCRRFALTRGVTCACRHFCFKYLHVESIIWDFLADWSGLFDWHEAIDVLPLHVPESTMSGLFRLLWPSAMPSFACCAFSPEHDSNNVPSREFRGCTKGIVCLHCHILVQSAVPLPIHGSPLRTVCSRLVN